MNKKSYKQILTYDEKIGFKYVKNLNTTLIGDIDDEMEDYKIVTDNYGFRNDFDKNLNPVTFENLFLGCSFVAGDCVENKDRFSDLTNKNSYNAAIQATCMYQQCIAGIECSDYIKTKKIFFMPFLGCILRNLKNVRETNLYDARHIWNKPDISIGDNCLTIKNEPIPKPLIKHERKKEINFMKKKYLYIMNRYRTIISGMPLIIHKWGIEFKSCNQVENISKTLKILMNHYPDASLVIAPIPNRSYLKYSYRKINKYTTNFFQKISKRLNAEYIDIASIIIKEKYSNYYFNEGHLNKKGHLRFSKLINSL